MNTEQLEALSIGKRVSYEDMANPRRTGTIADIETFDGLPYVRLSYVIAWDEGRISQSDCRQCGWRVEQ